MVIVNKTESMFTIRKNEFNSIHWINLNWTKKFIKKKIFNLN